MKKMSSLLQALSLISVSLVVFIPTFIQADQTEYPEQISERLQQKYDSLDSLSFNFKQRSRGQLSGRPKTGNGTAYFYKSGGTSLMRWNYNEPDRQVLVSDGKTFSMYFEELQQMIVTSAEQLNNDLTYSFFSGREKIGEKFHILPPEPEYAPEKQDETIPKVIKLVPKEENSQVQEIHLWISADSLIRRIEIKDHFGTITLINISEIKENDLADASEQTITTLFSFTPPEDTEIIQQ
ncbi:outer membrane lipoprotein carrier protein LolA [Desulfopila sp. IMCC35008]|uniref:LolA family protein n=1 Tax=Desulfopila sp. IMCC35008 TaxID=2653858 RepID=UPI0013D08D2E|nr:outer membrane lipoprotein carrier protein LolA [Desulfopila sp. IMCC35008]